MNHGNADGAVLVWNGGTADRVQTRVGGDIATGCEPIALAVARTLEGLPGLGLLAEEEQDAQAAGEEVVEPEPDRSKTRRLGDR